MSSLVVSARSFDSLLARVSAAIYPPIADFEITAWVTREPVKFSERASGAKKTLRVGEPWADRLFDCAWFRFRAPTPPAESSALVARIDVNGELCVVDAEGEPVRGLTCVHSVFDRSLGTPAKTIYRLPPEVALGRPGEIELWADAGLNDLFGSVPREGRIEFAQLCRCREDIRTLHYDLEVLVDLQRTFAEEASLSSAIAQALERADDALAAFTPEEVASVRQSLEPLRRAAPSQNALQVSAIGHAHLDLAWLWPIRETFRKGARTFATALYNFERYPEYIFGVSQPQLFAWMQQQYPALYSRIKAAAKAGRIEPLGGMWVEPDCNLPSGESLVRQVVHGKRYFREEFDAAPRFCWQPDVFGYNAQLPQILKKTGHDYFMTQKLSWNLVNRFPHHSFRWEGIDGSSVLAHMLPEETYNGPAAPRSLDKIARNYAQRDVSNHALMVYGIGDGGGGPDAEHLERIRRLRALPRLPAVTHCRAAEFFELWAKDAEKFPRWSGELYLERHQGTFTTQALTKRNNRRCEIALYELECAATLAEFFAGAPYPTEALDRLWKEVLLYQFHDILPGSSIKRVYDECSARYAAMLQELETLISENHQALAARFNLSGSALVFNSLSWARQEWVHDGQQWLWADVPAMGFAALATPMTPAKIYSGNLQAEPHLLANEHLRVAFAPSGEIAWLFDLDAKREVLAAGKLANQFLVFDDAGDAWDFPSDYAAKPPRRLRLVESHASLDGPCAKLEQRYEIGASRLKVTISLKAGSRLLEFDVRADWRETRAMLRVRFPVAIETAQARCEIPYGSVSRSILSETSWEKAQIEVPALQWVDLSQDDYGVALFNDCKHGYRLKGPCLDMNLIRSVPHPGQALINKDDASAAADDAVFTDLGEHAFRYALWPHVGRAAEGELTRRARSFNVPLRLVTMTNDIPAPRSRGSRQTFVEVSDAGTEVTALKRAEDGQSWILRLNRVEPTPARVQIRLALPVHSAVETDLLENVIRPLPLERDGTLLVEMGPFEVKTLRLLLNASAG